MVLSLLCVPFVVEAQEPTLQTTLSADKQELSVGSTVRLSVTLSGDRPYQAFGFTVIYDADVLTFVSGADCQAQPERGMVLYASVGNELSKTAELTFMARSACDTMIKVEQVCLADHDIYEAPSASVSISVQPLAGGDVNGDEFFDTADLVLMKKNLAGLINDALPVDQADLNKDGTVDTADLVLMKKCLAGLL